MNITAVPMPDVEGVTHRSVDVAGVAIHVAEAGSGSPVLLLHGWPQHWYAWRKVLPALAGEYRLICPDMRGFGWSEATAGGYAKRDLAKDVIALMDTLEIESADLLAHDWGAWIGFILCLDHPERFRHYLALNIYTPWPEGPSLRGLVVLARLWYQVVLALPWVGEWVIRRTPFVRRLIAAGAVGHPWTNADLEIFSAVLREPARAAASSRLYRTFLTHELLPFLAGQNADRRLTVPTLLLHGMRDLAIDHRALGAWQTHAQDMTVELRPDSGHFIAEELPDIVAGRARALFSATTSQAL